MRSFSIVGFLLLSLHQARLFSLRPKKDCFLWCVPKFVDKMEPNGTGRRPPHCFTSHVVPEMLENLGNDRDSDNLLSDDDDPPYAGSRSSSNSSSSDSETDYGYARSKCKCSNRGALPTTQSERHGRPHNEEQNRSRSRSPIDRSRAETERARSRNCNGLVDLEGGQQNR